MAVSSSGEMRLPQKTWNPKRRHRRARGLSQAILFCIDIEWSAAHRALAAGRQVGFPEFEGAVPAGDKRRSLGGALVWFFFRDGGPLLGLERLLHQFRADFRGKRTFDGVEHMGSHDPCCDADVGEVVAALRVFPLNAETVGLANGGFRKQESQRSQEQKSAYGGASSDRGIVEERDIDHAVKGDAAEFFFAVVQDEGFVGWQAGDGPVGRDGVQKILQIRDTSPINISSYSVHYNETFAELVYSSLPGLIRNL